MMDNDAVQEFLNNGGTITVCPPAEKFAKRAKQQGIGVYVERQRSHIQKLPDKKICMTCPNMADCQNMCAPLLWINGNKPLREKLLDNDMEGVEYRDYKGVLAEQIESARERRVAFIEDILDVKKRAVIILLDEGFKIPQLAKLFRCSERSIQRYKA
jgi:hypothetical protein